MTKRSLSLLTLFLTGAVVLAAGPPARAQAPPSGPPAAQSVPPRVLYGPEGDRLPFPNDEQILEFLKHARVLEKTPIGQGVTQPDRLLLERSGVRARAVFHDINESKRNVRLAGKGFIGDFRDSYRNQVAGYEMSRLLGMDNVPPAVVREVDGVEGSAALWIEDGYLEMDRERRGAPYPDRVDWDRRLADIRVFDNVINNIDRNQTNILFDSHGKIWMIDTTRAFGATAELPYEARISRCSRSLWEALRSLDREAARRRLRPYLSGLQIKMTFRRLDRLIQLMEERIAERGEARVLFHHGDPDDNVRVLDELPPGP